MGQHVFKGLCKVCVGGSMERHNWVSWVCQFASAAFDARQILVLLGEMP